MSQNTDSVRTRLSGMEATDRNHMYAVTFPSHICPPGSADASPIISLYRSFGEVVACVERCEKAGIEGVNVHWLTINDA